MIFRNALTQGQIKNNPTEEFKMPIKQQSVEELEKAEENIVFLEKEELAHFLKLAYTDGLEMDHLVFTLLSYTGMRIGELLALNGGILTKSRVLSELLKLFITLPIILKNISF
jgi:integrase